MQYLAMLYGNEDEQAKPGTPEWDAEMLGYMRFGEKHTHAIRGGEALLGTDQAVTVRAAGGGAPLVTNGPFAESAEVVGGFYVLEADTLDEVIAMVADIPAASSGSVEVRPVVGEWMDANYLTPSDPGSRYLALIVDTPLSNGVPDTPEWEEGARQHGAFAAAAGDAIVAGVALHPTTTATTVRVRGDDVLVADGPFAEANEVVGGFYLLRGPDRETVTDLAARIPVGPQGVIEVWKVMDLG
jgi:hypothetical protein